MKKAVIYTCTGLIVTLLSVGMLWQQKSTKYVDNSHTVTESSDAKDMPVLKFVRTRIDFGTVRKKDSPTRVNFEFQNAGDVPLVIHKVDVSCGCMEVDFPKEPTMPGQKGTVTIVIDTKDRPGAFNKTLFVKSNANEDVILLRVLGQIK